jgi:hypothetical protein
MAITFINLCFFRYLDLPPTDHPGANLAFWAIFDDAVELLVRMTAQWHPENCT